MIPESESPDLTKSLLDAGRVGMMLVDRKAHLLLANAEAIRGLGRPAAALAGSCVYDALSPDLAKALAAAMEEAGRRSEPVTFRHESHGRHLEHTVTPLPAGRYAIQMLDISEGVEAKNALKRERMIVEKSLFNIRDLFYLFSPPPDMKFIRWNRRVTEVSGYTDEEVAGLSPLDFFFDEDKPAVAAAIRQAFEEGSAKTEAPLRTKDGRGIPHEFDGTRITDEAGHLVGLAGTSRNTTDARKAAEDLKHARDAAEAASRAKSAFLANMSHEIRTPMNAILGFSQLLMRESALTQRQRDWLETINRSGEYLLSIINDVLDMSKIEAGRATVQNAPFDLHGLIHELETMFRMRAEAKLLAFHLDRGDASRFIVGDERKLRQMLVNLLGNAVKFTDRGGVTLRFRTASGADGGTCLIAEVEDTGPGITAEYSRRLFVPFEQDHAGVSKGGTGLGLAITRQFAHLMGGRISVESEPGKGSLFRLEIPVRVVGEGEMPRSVDRRQVKRIRPGLGPFRVLVVDDIAENRILLLELLKGVGFETREAKDGTEAIARYEDWSPHVILLDVRMPGMSGHEVLRRIKATERGRATKVISLTASAFDQNRSEAIQAGADDFIGKPFREQELFDKLRTHLRLEYEYEEDPVPAPSDEASAAKGAGPPLAASLSRLPADLRENLRKAVLAARYAEILDLIAQVETRDPRAAGELRALADQFDYASLLAAIETG